MKRLPLALVPLLFALGCAPAEDPAEDPATSFNELESRLLDAQSFSFAFHVTSEGVIDGDLRGTVSASKDGQLAIEAEGTFISREIQMRLATDADSMRMDTNEMTDVAALPQDTYRAVAVGLTRMGILHNLAQLSTVTAP